jgi:hypothetical protein
MIAILSKPTLRINPSRLTFNAACMKLMPDVSYVQFLHCFERGWLYAAECGAFDYDNTPWRANCSGREIHAKHVKWRQFYTFICDGMNWLRGNEYTVSAVLQNFEEKRVIFFDLYDYREYSPLNMKMSDFQVQFKL